MGTRVFIGRLSNSATERDVERFFKGYGKIHDIVFKTGFGFVEFDDPRDADDAVYDLNGRTLCGERVTIEHARSPNVRNTGGRGGGGGGGGGYDRGGSSYGSRRPSNSDRDRDRDRYSAPVRTDYKVIVENVSSRVNGQDLKEFLSKVGEVTFSEVHKDRMNEGVVEFATLGDMKNVLTKLNGVELKGRNIRLIEDKSKGRRASKSPSRKRSGGGRSKSRSPRSRSPLASRSRSKDRKSPVASRSRSGSRSPMRSSSPPPPRDGGGAANNGKNRDDADSHSD